MASKPWTGPEIDLAIKRYRTGESLREIGRSLHRDKDALIRVLRANNVEIRRQGRPSLESERKCSSFERMKEEAAFGSLQLLLAIERAGLRPA